MIKNIKIYKNLKNIPTNKGYDVSKWKSKIFMIQNASGKIIIMGVSSHIYYIFTKFNNIIPFLSRGDDILFSGKIVRNVTYILKDKQPVWGVLANAIIDKKAENRYQVFIDTFNLIKQKLNFQFNSLVKHYPRLKNKYSQIEFEKGFITLTKYYKSDSIKFKSSYQNDLNKINNILNNIQSNPFKYTLAMIKKNLNVEKFNNFIKSYSHKLDTYQVKQWSINLDSVRKEKEKIFVTDWNKVAKKTLDVISGLFVSAVTKNYDVGSIMVSDALDEDVKSSKIIDVVYLYGKSNNFYYKVKVPENEINKLKFLDKGDKVYFSGKIVAIKNNTIYVIANKILTK